MLLGFFLSVGGLLGFFLLGLLGLGVGVVFVLLEGQRFLAYLPHCPFFSLNFELHP